MYYQYIWENEIWDPEGGVSFNVERLFPAQFSLEGPLLEVVLLVLPL